MPQQIKFDKYPEKTVQGYKAVQAGRTFGSAG